MKRIFTSALLSLLFCFSMNAQDMIITGVFDGPLAGGTPKVIEMYVINNIADLSLYGFGSANNGGGTDGVEFTFSGSATAGDFLYLATTTTEFNTYFGFNPDFVDGSAAINGDDAVELFFNGVAYDVFGDINVDGSGTAWDYVDGWAYRNNFSTVGTTFVVTNWTYSGIDATDGQTSNATSTIPFPIGTYQHTSGGGGNAPSVEFQGMSAIINEGVGTLTVNLTIANPNANATSVDVTLSGSSTATNGADFTFTDPTTVTFPANSTMSQSIAIPITDDMMTEGDETIVLTLANPTNTATIGTNGTFTATIAANDMVTANLVITEIFYNVPTEDTLEFVEIYNNETVPVNLAGYTFSSGVVYTFPAITLGAGQYLVVCNDSIAFQNAFGIAAYQWTSGSLNNAGETVQLSDNNGLVVDAVTFGDDAPWAQIADGFGNSIALCNVNANNALAANWLPEINDANLTIEGISVFASPGAANAATCPTLPYRDIALLIESDDITGVADSVNAAARIQGFAYGVNMRPAGLDFTVIDAAGEGVAVFSFNPVSAYAVTEGDYLVIDGSVTQFNGLIQFTPTNIQLVSGGHQLLDAEIVTMLDEDTESQLVTIENVTLLNPAQWTNSGSGFNVDMTNGADTFLIRIDNDVNIFGMSAPQGTFNVTGIGRQFDNSSPYTEGYQLFPRYAADINPYVMAPPAPLNYPAYDIATIETVNTDGVADSLNVRCSLTGIVHGVNTQGANGLGFTIIDATGGIGVFKAGNPFNYTVTEGDEITVKGKITQFNGLTQIEADSLMLNSSNNATVVATAVTALDESTESELVSITGLTLIDPIEWNTTGSSFSASFTDGTNTYTIRIDNDVNIAGTTPFNLATDVVKITGLGGQFDNSSPYTSGYQLLPRSTADIEIITSTRHQLADVIRFYPNPAQEVLMVETTETIETLTISNSLGQIVATHQNLNGNTPIALEGLTSGLYFVTFKVNETVWTQKIIKQ